MTTLTIDMSLLRSDRAIVGRSQHRTSDGVGDVHYVILADGYMLDCGSGYGSEDRAIILARIINAADADLRRQLDGGDNGSR